MADTDFNIGLVAQLDPDKSKTEINNDIQDLQKKLDKLKLNTEIDQSQLDDLKTKIENLSVKLNDVTISASALTNLVDQVNDALQGIQINSVNIGGSGRKVSIKGGELVSDAVQDSVNKISSPEIEVGFKVNKADSDSFNKAVDDEIARLQKEENKLQSVRFTTNTEYQQIFDSNGNATGRYESIEKLTGAVFKYNTAAGEAISKTMKWAQIDSTFDAKGNEIPVMGWVQGLTTYSKSLDEATQKTDSFADRVSTAVTKANNQLATIESKLADKNESKTLANFTDTEKSASGLTAAIDKVKTAISGLQNSTKATFASANNDVATAISELNNLIAKLKNAEYAATSLRTKDVNTVKIDESNKLDAFIEKMKQSGHYTTELQTDVATLKTTLSSVYDASTLTNYLNGLSNLQSKFESIDASARTLEKQKNLTANIESEQKILDAYVQRLKDAGVYSEEVRKKFEEMYASLQKVDTPTGLSTWKAELRGVKSETDQALKSARSFATELSRINKAESMQKWADNNTKAMKKYGDVIQSCIDKMRNLNVQMTKAEFSQIDQLYKNTISSARQEGLLGMSWLDKMKDAGAKFTSWATATGVVMRAYTTIRKMPAVVTELDTSLVDLKKTTSMSADELERFYYRANDIAKDTGVTTNDILEQAAAWSRLGYSTADAAEKMARYSAMFKMISPGMNLNSATDGLVSVMKAFKIGEENVDDVLDGIMSKVNIIGNTRAINNSDIIDFLTRSSSAMAEANNTLEDTIALGTAAVEVTRNASEAGNALKTVSMRVRGRQSLPPYVVMHTLCA